MFERTKQRPDSARGERNRYSVPTPEALKPVARGAKQPRVKSPKIPSSTPAGVADSPHRHPTHGSIRRLPPRSPRLRVKGACPSVSSNSNITRDSLAPDRWVTSATSANGSAPTSVSAAGDTGTMSARTANPGQLPLVIPEKIQVGHPSIRAGAWSASPQRSKSARAHRRKERQTESVRTAHGEPEVKSAEILPGSSGAGESRTRRP